jgi:hypothetical protein
VREAGEPNGNADFLAAKFRDELMPSRKELHRKKSPLVTVGRVSESSWLVGGLHEPPQRTYRRQGHSSNCQAVQERCRPWQASLIRPRVRLQLPLTLLLTQ